MTHARTSRPAATISILAFALALALTVAGCGSTPAATTATAPAGTAKAGLPLAISVLASVAPDAKLLVVQTESPVATATPVWGYLFGSPASDKTYLVVVDKGKAAPASEIGTAGLSAQEWSAVPNADEWKINSDAAYQAALPAAGGKSDAAYMMGFITYLPASEVSATTKPFVWYVSFDPASGATTGTVLVDAKTGAVLAK